LANCSKTPLIENHIYADDNQSRGPESSQEAPEIKFGIDIAQEKNNPETNNRQADKHLPVQPPGARIPHWLSFLAIAGCIRPGLESAGPVEQHSQADDYQDQRPPGAEEIAKVKFEISKTVEQHDRAEDDEYQTPYYSRTVSVHMISQLWGHNKL
jgi:hypothetical protein